LPTGGRFHLNRCTNAQLREALKKALDSFSPKYRQVVILRDIEHQSITETVQLLGIKRGRSKDLSSTCQLIMRDQLAPGFDGAWKKAREYQKLRPWLNSKQFWHKKTPLPRQGSFNLKQC
jgi:endonuclease III